MTEYNLQSNRDLYLAIVKLSEEYKYCELSLEEYLLVLLQEANRFKDRELLSLDNFYSLISIPFNVCSPKFNEDWRSQYDQLPNDSCGFERWRSILIRQIVDLREMKENGTLADKERYFGVNSPRGSRWYNFDPLGYLECAMAGSFSGWEDGDESDRQFVPGLVSIIAENGSIQDADPRDLVHPQFKMPTVSWDEFNDFIQCGQYYE
jgi:hypothetical protein